ncbi:MAG: 2'-5' RNA ligase [Candidatus Lloydbacteria bacterium RIFCSPHIGHO2_01_FULL_49_22]|uniref:RNA 2',3'-cyclic phosphodiesterase n=1 Tax=Candidatus Lloydbacteria bacterium RIFCSPHIGHO2_01_FULL_49_22 TaxID=1798658 RepID=A0A1G2CUV4_9BACT|nr:MAG: 2'-5' RNA ligase [Candidatus Lloydbacteria bacterium RIFCSPHIGHO2_01_FULL_49_22]OGZ09598.1 MAG: 2'-5' RNA ligase [Candidatus Lloydbacteria bacterium RIFCSPHIGHO2_02_FULL_50_18]
MDTEKLSKRVFVGIKVSTPLAEYCAALQSCVAGEHVRLIPSEDMHLTLVTPWNTTDERAVIQRLQDALRNTKPFSLTLDRLACGPNNDSPKLLWIECAASPELVALERILADAFDIPEHRPFIPHITIARCAKDDQERSMPHHIAQRVEFSMTVDAVQLFLSPEQGGVGYTILASIPLLQEDIVS